MLNFRVFSDLCMCSLWYVSAIFKFLRELQLFLRGGVKQSEVARSNIFEYLYIEIIFVVQWLHSIQQIAGILFRVSPGSSLPCAEHSNMASTPHDGPLIFNQVKPLSAVDTELGRVSLSVALPCRNRHMQHGHPLPLASMLVCILF